MTTVSLCSYTYNDGALLHGLLAGVPAWTVQPDEIVLVDDGSAVPFALGEGETRGIPTRLIRLPENNGFTMAKHTGLSAAQGEVLFSLDCDSRVQPDFLRCCLEVLQRPEAGLVSGCMGFYCGTDLLSGYLNLFGEKFTAQPMEAKAMDFLPGAAFVLRKELWESLGGFSGFVERNAEDHYLCGRIRERGLQVLLDGRVHLRYVRTISRHAYCRRTWTWCGRAWQANVRPENSLPEYFFCFFINPSLERCSIVIKEQHPLEYLYIELLLVVSLAFFFCRELGGQGRIPAGSAVELERTLTLHLAPYPILNRLLRADLLRTGALPVQVGIVPESVDSSRRATVCNWQDALYFLEAFHEERLLEWLNAEGVRRVLQDEVRLRSSFSSY